MKLSDFPPGVTGSEPEIAGWPGEAEWDAWADSVKPGDPCLCAGVAATVTAVTPDFLWARLEGRAEAEPWAWEDVGPVERASAEGADDDGSDYEEPDYPRACGCCEADPCRCPEGCDHA